jgi:TDG/mug DNA glycosylase family protein
LAANTSWEEKVAIWKPFGEWVQRRREERGFVVGVGGEGEGENFETGTEAAQEAS